MISKCKQDLGSSELIDLTCIACAMYNTKCINSMYKTHKVTSSPRIHTRARDYTRRYSTLSTEKPTDLTAWRGSCCATRSQGGPVQGWGATSWSALTTGNLHFVYISLTSLVRIQHTLREVYLYCIEASQFSNLWCLILLRLLIVLGP